MPFCFAFFGVPLVVFFRDSAFVVFTTLKPFCFAFSGVQTVDVLGDSAFVFFTTLRTGKAVDIFFFVVFVMFKTDILLLLK